MLKTRRQRKTVMLAFDRTLGPMAHKEDDAGNLVRRRTPMSAKLRNAR
jgi:hypothetical protein